MPELPEVKNLFKFLLQVWVGYHILDGMKMTLNIDDDLLNRVMEAMGASSKTAAIDLALREVARRATLVKIASEGLGLSSDALKEAIDPAYNLDDLRRRETPVTYGRKPSSRR